MEIGLIVSCKFTHNLVIAWYDSDTLQLLTVFNYYHAFTFRRGTSFEGLTGDTSFLNSQR